MKLTMTKSLQILCVSWIMLVVQFDAETKIHRSTISDLLRRRLSRVGNHSDTSEIRNGSYTEYERKVVIWNLENINSTSGSLNETNMAGVFDYGKEKYTTSPVNGGKEQRTTNLSCGDYFCTPLSTAQSFTVNELSLFYKCDPNKDAMLISTCPASAEKDDLILCQSDEVPPTVDAIFPITDSASGYHFRNLYCWKCSDHKERGNPLRWSADVAIYRGNTLKLYADIRLEDFLRFVLENPLSVTWKPPSPFSYPACKIDTIQSRPCTMCVSNGVNMDGCVLISGSSAEHMGESMKTACYLCRSNGMSANNSLGGSTPCQHNANLLLQMTLSSPNTSSYDVLEIERDGGSGWRTLQCSMDTGTCTSISCLGQVVIRNRTCDTRTRRFNNNIQVCRHHAQELGRCFEMKRNQGFLLQQFIRFRSEPLNLTAIDSIYLISNPTQKEQKSGACDYQTSDLEPESGRYELANPVDIITSPMNQLISFYNQNQTDVFPDLEVEITEEKDYDSLGIFITGWEIYTPGQNAPLLLINRIISLLIQTFMKSGFEGKLLFCSESVSWRSDVISLTPCVSVTFCSQKDFGIMQLPTSDTAGTRTVGIAQCLGVILLFGHMY